MSSNSSTQKDSPESANKESGPSLRRKGIYILPNLFTIASLFSGFFAIIAAMNNHFILAAMAVFIAMILDGLDGRVARLINAQSAFGAELDSLSDMVSFGVAPALILYNFNLASLHVWHWDKLGWMSTFIYVACVALRLARFNTQVEVTSGAKRYFYGLPCPAAAAFVASLVWVLTLYGLNGFVAAIVTSILMIFVALLMVSSVRFRSFKDIDLRGKVRFAFLVVLVLLLVLLSWQTAQLLLAIFAVYVFSGPVLYLLNWRRKADAQASDQSEV